MDFQYIEVTTRTGIGILSLNRPDLGNAVNPAMLREICDGINRLAAADDVKAILLRGAGRHFCTGADFEFLERLTTMSPVDIQQDIYTHFQGAARRLYHCRKPTVALIGGAAVTVGCELALACDFRVLAETAFLQESWIRLGLMPPLGGLFLLPRMVGLARAKQMVLRAEKIGAQQALAMGLAADVVAAEVLDERGEELARELGQLPALAYASVKQALHRGLETSMEAEWSSNLHNQAVLLGSEDFREGLRAAREKRPPQFRGR